MKYQILLITGLMLLLSACNSKSSTAKTSVEIDTVQDLEVEVDNQPVEVDNLDTKEKVLQSKVTSKGKDKESQKKGTNLTKTSKVVAAKEEKDQVTGKTSTVEERNTTEVKAQEVGDKQDSELQDKARGGETDVDYTSSKSSPATKPEKPQVLDKNQGSPTHKEFDALLSTYVSGSGVVDYRGLKAEVSKLDAYLSQLSEMSPDGSWPETAELSYWINAYNAYTLKLILDNYPLKSITDLHGGKPWDVKWIEIGGKTYSLNNIENDIIRPQFMDARIHFAVNCAAKSCPPLANKAYTYHNVEQLLEKRTKDFINNEKYTTLSHDQIVVSKIFDWYKEDFGNVATYVSRYASKEVSPKAKVEFMEYDWSLNGK